MSCYHADCLFQLRLEVGSYQSSLHGSVKMNFTRQLAERSLFSGPDLLLIARFYASAGWIVCRYKQFKLRHQMQKMRLE